MTDRFKSELDLRQVVTDDVPHGRTPVLIPCIYHDEGRKPNLAVYPDGVNCFACGANKPPLMFIEDLKGVDMLQAMVIAQGLIAGRSKPVPARSTVPIDPTPLLAKVDGWADKLFLMDGNDYLRNRGLTDATIKTAKLGHTGRAYTIPLFDQSGGVYWVRYRRDDSFGESMPKYWAEPGLHGTHIYFPPTFKGWATYTGVVTLVEGEFDTLVLSQRGVPAITVNNGVRAIKNVVGQLGERFKGVVLALDQDGPGRSGAEEAAEELKSAKVPFVRVEWDLKLGKDATDVFGGGYADMLLAWLRTAYRQILKGEA